MGRTFRKKTINSKSVKKKLPYNGTFQVSTFMKSLYHPMKSEIEAVRSIIKNANPRVLERVKWNAPSFFYKTDMAFFNLRAERYVQLIIIFPKGVVKDSTGLLLGDWKDRREARFYDTDDIIKKKPALERVVNEWVSLIDSKHDNKATNANKSQSNANKK